MYLKGNKINIAHSATDPRYSAWVSASAGTGKTYLLSSRFLRLLLQGAPASSILCLTFTQNAAQEMQTRIMERLAEWALADEPTLHHTLQNLLGIEVVPPIILERARSLYIGLIESATHLRIMTLHRFCWSLLSQFPTEAGLTPGTKVISDLERRQLLQTTYQHVWQQALDPNHPLYHAVYRLSEDYGGDRCQKFCTEILAHAEEFDAIHDHQPLYTWLNTEPGLTPEMLQDSWKTDEARKEKMLSAASALFSSSVTMDQHLGKQLLAWWQSPNAPLEDYFPLFLTQKDLPRKKIISNGFAEQYPDHTEHLYAELEAILALHQQCNAYKAIAATQDILTLAAHLLAAYQNNSEKSHRIDFDALIQRTRLLLQNPTLGPWVLYRLGERTQHVLVDEAQDTSFAQWHIIHALTQDFLSTTSDSTLFVVGDIKQSIYGFQGADTALFVAMEQFYHRQQDPSTPRLQQITLTHSFRSAPSILQFVDAWANQPAVLQSLTQQSLPLRHDAYHTQLPGWVSIWPLIRPQENTAEETSDAWQIPPREEDARHPELLLAEHIAKTIAGWLQEGRMLLPKNRPLEPNDILILVRKRNQFIPAMIRALQAEQIAVAGLDRLKLLDSLAVQDMLALMRFIILPEDDFSLASVLKGPLYSISEEELFTLAHQRGEQSLWQRVRDLAPSYAETLSHILHYSGRMRPTQLLSYVLDRMPGRSRWYERQGEEALEMLDILMALAYDYEKEAMAELQGFITFLEAQAEAIPRDMDQRHSMVRIMTAHAAKGLQAPIVIIADSTMPPRSHDLFCWSDTTPALPIILDKHTKSLPQIQQLLDIETKKQEEEYWRLFYVAITRAEYGLILCGAAKRDAVASLSWYMQGSQALKQLGVESVGTMKDVLGLPSSKMKATTTIPPITKEVLAPWMTTPLDRTDITTNFTLLPSLLETTPSSTTEHFAFGLIVHQALEHGAYFRERPEHLGPFLTTRAPSSDVSLRHAAGKEILATLQDPTLADFFHPDSHAEVPLYGEVTYEGKTRLLSGRIDRLLIRDTEVWFLDFKTHRQPPATLPESMRSQLTLYALALENIYPGKQIRGFVYFTQSGKLVEALQEACTT